MFDFFKGLFSKENDGTNNGLEALKRRFDVVSENLSDKKGERVYKTASGHTFRITSKGNSLKLDRDTGFKDFHAYDFPLGKIMHISRSYYNTVVGDSTFVADRTTTIWRANKIKERLTGFKKPYTSYSLSGRTKRMPYQRAIAKGLLKI